MTDDKITKQINNNYTDEARKKLIEFTLAKFLYYIYFIYFFGREDESRVSLNRSLTILNIVTEKNTENIRHT